MKKDATKIWTDFASLLTFGIGAVFLSSDVQAAEGGSSNYFPGAYGALLPALAPDVGYVASSMNLFYHAKADKAVRNGKVELEIEANALYSYSQLFRTWDTSWEGVSFAIGLSVPLAYSEVKSSVITGGGPISSSGNEFALGDIAVIPASLYWSSGNLHFNLYEMVIMPTGQYDVGASVNIGRNYWSFDTVLAATWFDPDSGTEFSLVSGLMINIENPATNYKTGNELHFDAMFNKFVTENTALGLHGYAYKQLTGDSGTGTHLGAFKGSSIGIGPAYSYVPTSLDGKFALTIKYMKDLEATNRLKAGYGLLNLSWVF